MCAGRPSRVVEFEPLVPSSLPTCWMNLPSGENCRIWSPSLLPPTQTLPAASTWMPCSFFTQLPDAGPHEASRLPSASNLSTAGADLQHLVCGGSFCAPFSSSSSEAGRCTIQMWSFLSTAMPETWPRIQFSGSGFGQNGCGSKRGMVSGLAWACAAPGNNTLAITKSKAARTVMVFLPRITGVAVRKFARILGLLRSELPNQSDTSNSMIPVSLRARSSQKWLLNNRANFGSGTLAAAPRWY